MATRSFGTPFWTLVCCCYSLYSSISVVTGLETSDTILVESFGDLRHTWQPMNDPVMGGQSTGTFTVSNDGIGIFDGDVVDVPFLHAPGFIQVRTTDHRPFPDISSCQALQMEVRTSHPEYTGYRVSFGNKRAPSGKRFAFGFKANLENLSQSQNFTMVEIPFRQFTDFWDDLNGDPIHTCEENELYCPDVETLRNIKTLAIWGEGVAGKVSLEIKTISAVGCASRNKDTASKLKSTS